MNVTFKVAGGLAIKADAASWNTPAPEPVITTAVLGDVLASEANLLQDLLAVLRSQREALRSDDLQAVEDGVFATRRVLHTLSEARRRRDTIYRLLGVPRDAGACGLAANLKSALPEELRVALDGLIAAADALSSEVELNRGALQAAFERASSVAASAAQSTP
jgi:hypothetical protein